MFTIGFIGLAGSGKDTSCNYMADVFFSLGFPINKTSFALPLKTIARLCFGDMCDDRDKKEILVPFGVEKIHAAVNMCVMYYKEVLITNEMQSQEYLVSSFRKKARSLLTSHAVDNRMKLSPRMLQQLIGTDLFRNHVRESFWVDLVRSRLSKDKVNFLSDVRFINEALVCDAIVVVKRDCAQPVANHVSESLSKEIILDEQPETMLKEKYGYGGRVYTVENNGQLWQLQDTIARLSLLVRDNAVEDKKLPLDTPFTLES